MIPSTWQLYRDNLGVYWHRIVRTFHLVWQSGPRLMILDILLAFAQNLPPIAIAYLTKLIVDKVTLSLTEPAIDAGQLFASLVPLLLAVLGALLVMAAARTASSYVSLLQTQQVTNYVFDSIHQKAAELDLSYYDDARYQDVIFLAKQALNSPQSLVSSLTNLAQNIVAIVTVGVALFLFDPRITLLLLIAALPTLLIKLYLAPRRYAWHKAHASEFRLVSYLSSLLTLMNAAKEIRLYKLTQHLINRYQGTRSSLQQEQLQQSRLDMAVDLLTQTIVAASGIAIYGYVAYLTILRQITIGDMVMYYQLFQRGQNVLQSITGNITSLVEKSIYASSVFDFIDLPSRITPPDATVAKRFPHPMREGIRFEKVTFQYPTSATPTFRDLNLSIAPGEVVALVGANGAGKSTLIKLLCRFYDPVAGRITVDGIDLREFDLDSLRSNLGVIFQDFLTYELTVKENIWLGNVETEMDQQLIEDAAKRAEIHQKLVRLEDGYETELLGRWRKRARQLSGGEWQKLALARLFYRDSQILILDEPASALDAASEYNLFLTLKEATRDKSALIISHRFSTIRIADHIYVLDNGEIVEHGSHDELMRRDALYAYMFRLQAESYRSAVEETLPYAAATMPSVR